MSSDCVPEDVVGCVRDDPELAFGAFNNMLVLAGGVWFLFLTLQGIMRWSGVATVKELFSVALSGLGSFFTGFADRFSSFSPGAMGMGAVDRASRLLYLVVAGVAVALGWYYRSSVVLTSLILGSALVIALLLNFGGVATPYTTPVVGGLLLGMLITVIIWMALFFTVTSGNVFGGVMMILTVVWLFVTLFAWYGSRVRSPIRLNAKEG